MRPAMRCLISGIILLGISENAFAQSGPLPVLRGSDYRNVPATYRDWSGFYLGGQVGYSSGTADLASASASYLNPLSGQTVGGVFTPVSADWGTLGDGHSNSTPVGGFAGYNWQSDNAVFGVEINYNHFGNLNMSQTGTMTDTVVVGGYEYDISSSRRISAKMEDAVSMRMRAGAVVSQFLPYLSLGLAVARVSVTSTATAAHGIGVHTVDPIANPDIPAASITATVEKKGAIAWGASAGLGIDMEVMPHVLLRGEYEYLGFAAVEGIKTTVHTARVGVGLKF